MPIGSDRTIFRCTSSKPIQGVPKWIDYFSRGDRGTPGEQKIIWEGGLKCNPGETWAKNFFSHLLHLKNSSKSGLHLTAHFYKAKL